MANKRLYLLALEVAPLEIGGVYDVLPSHCTLMHRFWSGLSPTQLTEKLKPIFDGTEAIELVFESKAVFGPPPVHVNKIKETPKLKSLHMRLYEKLRNLGAEFTAPQWVTDGYKAHVTERLDAPFGVGHRHISPSVYLIEVKAPGNKEARYICAQFDLKH